MSMINYRQILNILAVLFVFFLFLSGFMLVSSIREGRCTTQTGFKEDIYNKQKIFDAVTDDAYQTFRIPGVVVTYDGTVLLYCEARSQYGDWSDMEILMKRSTDGGESWSERVLLSPENEKGLFNSPVIVAENKSSTVHFLYMKDNKHCYYRVSPDNGLSWSSPREITEALNGFKPEYEWAVAALGPGHGIQLTAGRLLIPIWLSLGTGANGHRPSVVSTILSDDGGDTWQRGEIIWDHTIENPNESTLVELLDGRIMINMRNEEYGRNKNYYRAVSISPDGISNWSEPLLDTQLPDPVCFGSLARYGDILIFANIHRETSYWFLRRKFKMYGNREPLGIRLSFDNGETWERAKIIEAEEAGYADIYVHQGIVYLFYEQGWQPGFLNITKNSFKIASLKLATFELEMLLSE